MNAPLRASGAGAAQVMGGEESAARARWVAAAASAWEVGEPSGQPKASGLAAGAANSQHRATGVPALWAMAWLRGAYLAAQGAASGAASYRGLHCCRRCKGIAVGMELGNLGTCESPIKGHRDEAVVGKRCGRSNRPAALPSTSHQRPAARSTSLAIRSVGRPALWWAGVVEVEVVS